MNQVALIIGGSRGIGRGVALDLAAAGWNLVVNYANNKTCAISATGWGEFFIRNVVAYDISALMEYKGFKISEASKIVINEKVAKLGGDGGVIGIDKNGNVAMEMNTNGMYRAHMNSKGDIVVKIYSDE